jgi:hypothetical protein
MYRIKELLQLDRKLYHTNDLAVLWGIKNRQTLYMTITRYIDAGVLYPVYKGLYATLPIVALDPLELGVAIIHRYTYLTTESVLVKAGVISQVIYDYTFVADRSRRVFVGQWAFRFRMLKDEYLYHPAGIASQEGILTASTERAAADLLYFNPKAHFDLPDLIDFTKVRAIQEEIGYP